LVTAAGPKIFGFEWLILSDSILLGRECCVPAIWQVVSTYSRIIHPRLKMFPSWPSDRWPHPTSKVLGNILASVLEALQTPAFSVGLRGGPPWWKAPGKPASASWKWGTGGDAKHLVLNFGTSNHMGSQEVWSGLLTSHVSNWLPASMPLVRLGGAQDPKAGL